MNYPRTLYLLSMVSFYLSVNNFFINGINLNFAYISTQQCGSDTTIFVHFFGVSLRSCIALCGLRPKCLAINYRQLYGNLCELLDSDADATTTAIKGNCMYLLRRNMDFSGTGIDACSCVVGETCDSAKGTCSKTECEPIRTISNGQIFGNRYNVGLSLRFTCDHNYKPQNNAAIITCMASGEWNILPECILNECPPLVIIDNGVLTGNNYSVGSSLTVTCNTDYREENGISMVTCLTTTEWDHQPNCTRKPCQATWLHFEDSCYYISDNSDGRAKTSNALTKCENMGGHLARFDTAAKTEFIRGEMQSQGNSNSNYWIGLRRVSGNWQWGDNGAGIANHNDWGFGQPEERGEDCVMLWGPDDFAWHDGICNWSAYFICEKTTYS